MPTIYPTTAARRNFAFRTPPRKLNRNTAVPSQLAHVQTPDAILTPSLGDTLAYWRHVLANQPSATIKAALAAFARGRDCGTSHIGYRRHRANCTALVQRGDLVSAGMNAYGQPLFRLAKGGAN